VNAAPAAEVSPWAFWSPASDAFIGTALDLLDLRPGERFLDLGCGDGRVMVEAARRGARPTGFEIDPRMAARARENLAAAGVSGEVIETDMFGARLESDAIYAYLTPVTLARLGPALTAAAGARFVSPAYPILGWKAQAAKGQCFLYELPPPVEPAPATRGWPGRALVVVLYPGRRSLMPLYFDAPAGPLVLEADGPLTRAADYAIPAPWCDAPARLPVDIIFNAFGAGTVLAGSLTCAGYSVSLAAVFADSGQGRWRFGPGEAAEFRRTLAEKATAARSPRKGTS
jgi:SAM-dependent methyltransferase